MAGERDRPGYSFGTIVPVEVSRFFRNKNLRPAFSFWDVEPEEHAVSFTVARMTQLDLLQDAKNLVQRAIDDGQTLAQFQRAWAGREGLTDWLGSQTGTDPSGQVITAPRRLRTIYRSNMRSARAAGQWERIERTKLALPYLLYQLGPSERHRPEHVAKAGLVIAVDDPFWDEWMPPNGWGCKCWVRQITAREAGQLGGVRQAPVIERRPFQNPRTGEVVEVPRGLDPSWRRNPGKLRRENLQDVLAGRMRALDPVMRQAAVRDIAASWAFQSPDRSASPLAAPIAFLPDRIARRLGVPGHILLTPLVAQHLFRDKTDRAMGDLASLEAVTGANRFRLQTNAAGRRSLHVLIEGAANTFDPGSASMHPLRAIFHLGVGGVTLATLHRTDRGKWLRRHSASGGFEVLDE